MFEGFEPDTGIKASAIVSRDGLVMASKLPSGIDEDTVAANVARILFLGEDTGRELSRGSLTQVLLAYDDGSIVLSGAGPYTAVMAMVSRESNLKSAIVTLVSRESKLKSITVSRDGLVMASQLPSGIDEDTVAANAARIFFLGEATGKELSMGNLAIILLVYDDGSIALSGAGPYAAVMTLVSKESNLEIDAIPYAIKDLAKKIQELLEG